MEFCQPRKVAENFDLSKYLVKVSKFQNEFMKSSSLPKYEPKIVSGISGKYRNLKVETP